ncbi:MAG: cysteine desulfurase family protein [Actinomycetota bacterium]|nr:cysteine desulfurase family protein [Actinomycetota bacterium]
MNRFSHYIYMDHSATTPVLREVADSVYNAMTLYFGNASEPHTLGTESNRLLEDSRKTIAEALNASPEEIIFTSGGTESNNMAIFGTIEAYFRRGDHIITSEIEHPAVRIPLQILENEGFKITYLPIDKYGIVNPEDIRKSIQPDTVLISIMHSNNIMGAVQPIEEIGKIARENEIVFHCDAVQSYMNIPLDVRSLNVDLLTISGHKVYAPKGVGALYVRNSVKIAPQILGGGQEKGLRSGTENIPGIIGIAKATDILSPTISKRSQELSALRDYIRDSVLSQIDGVLYNGHHEKRLPGNINFTFQDFTGESLVKKLDEYGIAVSAGSACHSSSPGGNEFLISMGICLELTRNSIRISLGFENTREEADYLIDCLKQICSSNIRSSSIYNSSLKEKYFHF